MRTAGAKGLPEGLVIFRHAPKNAMIPIVTVLGLQVGTLLGGAVDTAATAALRAEWRGQRPGPAAAFSFGPERDHYERLWPAALRTAAVRALMPYPGRLRTFLWERMSRLVEERLEAGETVAPDAIPQLLASTLAGLRY